MSEKSCEENKSDRTFVVVCLCATFRYTCTMVSPVNISYPKAFIVGDYEPDLLHHFALAAK